MQMLKTGPHLQDVPADGHDVQSTSRFVQFGQGHVRDGRDVCGCEGARGQTHGVGHGTIGHGLGMIGNGVLEFEHFVLGSEFCVNGFVVVGVSMMSVLFGGGGGLDGELK